MCAGDGEGEGEGHSSEEGRGGEDDAAERDEAHRQAARELASNNQNREQQQEQEVEEREYEARVPVDMYRISMCTLSRDICSVSFYHTLTYLFFCTFFHSSWVQAGSGRLHLLQYTSREGSS